MDQQPSVRTGRNIRPCRSDEFDDILAIINTAAEAYRHTIPQDCWHDPYMTAAALRSEIAAGIVFTGFEIDGALAGIMGLQSVRNVDLIRHAYVAPAHQGKGIGTALIADLRARCERQLLVGTWTAATWAIGFYERHRFILVPDAVKPALLQTYWTVSERQIETSVVLALPPLTHHEAIALMDAAAA